MPDSLVIPVVDEGLGNSAYLVDLGDGRALAVDPSRDLRALDATAERHGLQVVAVADTHLHADFLSGATRLTARDRAAVYESAAGGREFLHTGLGDGDEVDLGGLTLRAWATPGTPASTSPTCCSTATRRSGCSPAGRCLSVPLHAPTSSPPSRPNRSPAPSTPRCAAW